MKRQNTIALGGVEDLEFDPVDSLAAVHFDPLAGLEMLDVPAALLVHHIMTGVVELGHAQYGIRDWGIVEDDAAQVSSLNLNAHSLFPSVGDPAAVRSYKHAAGTLGL